MGKTRVFRSVARHPMLRRYLPIVERKREREREEVLASKGKFPSRKLLSLSLSVDGQEAF